MGFDFISAVAVALVVAWFSDARTHSSIFEPALTPHRTAAHLNVALWVEHYSEMRSLTRRASNARELYVASLPACHDQRI